LCIDDDKDVVEACIQSNAEDFIRAFPERYDTDLGYGGMLVSGGQKQRIAIARALIKKPAVLLLDEATSALDTASERQVQQAIDALQRDRQQTTIVIAHRLSTIRNADKICVVEKGTSLYSFAVTAQLNSVHLVAQAKLWKWDRTKRCSSLEACTRSCGESRTQTEELG
jgi:ABC-type multidrug transport system fused ATPase/permease subunit